MVIGMTTAGMVTASVLAKALAKPWSKTTR